ncbi:dehydrogenase [Cellvibrio zantedeschiae]|uniref:Dehydrogenase n=1 Tax=Cellvibrio zantedeschiae TaxID=1237077 RepID=A0ABQ3B7P1_9GAMM|nr:Ldh family oxidoreductase [Cellvibrio zantedeschiae]GGY82905.1 dehydrogenase [Cellvibrio zantedeschiae]
MTDILRVPYETLCEAVKQALYKAGVSLEQADLESSIMAEADLLEVPSHGVRMLPGLLSALAEKRATLRPQFSIVRELGAICVLDCDNGPGRYASAQAMDAAIQRARNFGVGVCLAKNTTHWGRAHAYASRAAQAGFIGMCTTNAIPTMAIAGAKKRVIGNNPLAIGIPNENASEPIVLDMAMSQAAVGKVGTWLREGKSAPDNWGIDINGNPTSDTKEILKGAVTPMGEHKGAGLALMFELLTAALAGSAFTYEILARDTSGIDSASSKIFIALNVEAFIERKEFNSRVKDFLSYLDREASPFQYPSERGWQARDKNLIEGVPLHKEIVEQLAGVGIRF